MTRELAAWCWPADRFGPMVDRFLRHLAAHPDGEPPARRDASLRVRSVEEAGIAIHAMASDAGLATTSAEVSFDAVRSILESGRPLIFGREGNCGAEFLAVLSRARRNVIVLLPDGLRQEIPIHRIEAALLDDVPLDAALARLVAAHVSPARRSRVLQHLGRERLGETLCGRCWSFSPVSEPSFGRALLREGVAARVAGFLAIQVVAQAAWIASWWVLGRCEWGAGFDSGWFPAWGLLIATFVTLRCFAPAVQREASIRLGALLRRRLLAGALRLDGESVRGRGVGHWLGVLFEAQWIENTALVGAFATVVALIELAAALGLLAMGAGGFVHAGLLAAWIMGLALTIKLLVLRYAAWTDARIGMAHDLIEKLCGHRTRLAQESPVDRHRGEDAQLRRYLDRSQRLDRLSTLSAGLAARGWLVAAWLGLLPVVLSNPSRSALALSVAGTVMAYLSLRRLAGGLGNALAAGVAGRALAPMFQAGPAPAALPAVSASETGVSAPGRPHFLIEAHDLGYRYPGSASPAIEHCDLKIESGARLVLTGASGAGKSTLVSLLCGWRDPQAGLILGGGIELRQLSGDALRRLVVAAPQFHENHVFSESLAYNLLLGRRWPPGADDLRDAARLCRELGMDDLIHRMPGGLFQQVGETGWQLSHGERSRLFVARALLQGSRIVILDESLGALDPGHRVECLRCVQRHADALVLVAHP